MSKIYPNREFEKAARALGADVSCLWQAPGPLNTLVTWIEALLVNRSHLVLVMTYDSPESFDVFTALNSNGRAESIADALKRCGLETKAVTDVFQAESEGLKPGPVHVIAGDGTGKSALAEGRAPIKVADLSTRAVGGGSEDLILLLHNVPVGTLKHRKSFPAPVPGKWEPPRPRWTLFLGDRIEPSGASNYIDGCRAQAAAALDSLRRLLAEI